MSFGGSLFGAGMDYGNFLPKRARFALALLFVACLHLAPDQTQAAMLEWAEAKSRTFVDSITQSLPGLTTPGTTQPPASP